MKNNVSPEKYSIKIIDPTEPEIINPAGSTEK
jgi:hypothetical protein